MSFAPGDTRRGLWRDLRRGLRRGTAAEPRLVWPHPATIKNISNSGLNRELAPDASKDYVSCLAAGVVTILENTYQPGDWIEVDGTYGEVKTIGTRAVHVVTADDTEVTIPHARLWSAAVANASGGNQSLLCVTNFYLHADHDGEVVRRMLADIAEASEYRKAETKVTVVTAETPWGTHYKLKAYVRDSRDQFAMVTDLTIRGKQQLRAMHITFAQAPFAESKAP
jgi:small conductance mechanosensitive channel